MLKSIIQHRRGTTAEWMVSPIIPKDGELLIEECENGARKFKFGDGVNLYINLPYASSGVDGLVYVDNLLQLTANGVPVGNKIEITGGSGSHTIVNLTMNNEVDKFIVATGKPAVLAFTFTSTFDGQSTGKCTCIVKAKGESIYYSTIEQGYNEIDLVGMLKTGSSDIELICKDSYGNTRTLNYQITVVDLKIKKDEQFNANKIFDKEIDFSYIPIGAGVSKTVHLAIDGKELPITDANKTTANGRVQYYTIPKQPHGSHVLQVYLTATINNTFIQSEPIVYEILCTEENREEAMLSSIYEVTKATQGNLISIPYNLYDPIVLTPEAEFIISNIVNGEEIVTSSVIREVPRGLQKWDTRTYPSGDVKFTIRYTYDLYGTETIVEKSHIVKVEELSVDVEAVKDKLQLYLSAAGRSNQEKNPDQWNFENITTTFTGFNWSSNGWVTDANGDQCLRLNGDARAVINIKPFSEDFKEYGKTIEFEYTVRDVNSRDAVVIDCYSGNRGFKATADTAFLQSSGTLIRCNYKDNERIRVTVTVDKLVDAKIFNEISGVYEEIRYGFVSIYVNGILSGCQVYTDTDSFSQIEKVAISLGSQYCGIDLYSIRIYTKALSIPEVLDNYIADMADPARKVSVYSDNDLLYLPSDLDESLEEYDDFIDNISYEKVIKQGKIPVITFTGPMPSFKGDKKKKTTRMKFEHPEYPELNFDLLLDQIDVQGTSSQYYVRKNWKVKLPEAKVHIPGYIPAKVFCIKVDYAEATGTHNTGAAMYVETLYDREKSIIPAQIVEKDDEGNVIKGDEMVRTTVAGYPVLIFEKATEDSIPVFASKGNFNYDKDAEDTFGFNENYDVECWEFCNNTSDTVNFLAPVPVDWSADFEPRYVPASAKWDDIDELLETRNNAANGVGTWDENSLEQGVKLRNLMTNCIANFAELVSWVNSTATYKIINKVKVPLDDNEAADLPAPVKYGEIEYTKDTKAYRLAKFKNEFENYFDMHYTSLYYVFTFFALMVDQRAKNLFLTRWKHADGTYKWYPYFYDNDTIFGINNEGALVFDYYHEDTDQLGSANVYNGQNSVLWNNFRECFATEIQATYAALRTKDAHEKSKLSYDVIIDQFITNGSEKYSAIVYNEDADYKYISMARPTADSSVVDTSNLYQVRGPGDSHLKYFIDNRIKYCDSKWFAGDYPSNYIFMRIYTPTLAVINEDDSPEKKAEKEENNRKISASLAAVPAKSDISIKPYSLMYAGVKYGANGILLQKRLQSTNEFYTFTAPKQENGEDNIFIDTETAIYGASEISSLGDLSGLYCGVISLGNASKLVELKIGNENPNYYNDNFREISVGSNRLLKKIDLRNCYGLGIAGKDPQKTLALNNCPNIEEIYAEGTNLETITLPNSGYVRILHLPNSTTTINIKNQLFLKDENFKLDDYSHVRQLCIDNCPKLDTAEMLNKCKRTDENGNEVWTVERVRLTNLNWSFDDVSFVNSLFTLKGLNADNFEQDEAYLEGTCHIKKLTGNEYATIKSHYPYLEITFDELTSNLYFKSAEDELLTSQVIYNGGDGVDPVFEGTILTPTKTSTAKYNYKYTGWTRYKDSIYPDDPDRANPVQANALLNVLGDRTLYPAFDSELRSYNVTFYNPSKAGNEKPVTVQTFYGYDAEYPATTPVKQDVVDPDNYNFIGWYPSIENITGDRECFAQFELKDEAWHVLTPEEIEWAFVNGGTELSLIKLLNTDYSVIRIPEYFTIEGANYPITTIANYINAQGGTIGCFHGMKKLERIKLPETITTIAENAFRDCTSLVSVELPDSLLSIGSRAFIGCDLLEYVKIPKNVKEIATQSFCDNAALNTIEVDPENKYYHVITGCLIEKETNTVIAGVHSAQIPTDKSVERIAAFAFSNSRVSNITLPESLVEIGDNAFQYCHYLTEISIPSKCKLGYTAFSWCSSLYKITFAQGVTAILSYAFNSCPVQELVLPSTLTQIGAKAFAENTKLRRVDFTNKHVIQIELNSFENSGSEEGVVFNLPWAETLTSSGMDKAPWGANYATVNYNVSL